MNYELFKPSAFLSRPLSQIKNVGVVSFSMRGTTYKEVTQTSNTTKSKMNPFGGVSSSTSVTTITVTKEFPWETLLEKLYPQFVAVIESEFGAKVLPIEKVTGCEAYKTLETFAKDDESTNVEFVKSYKNMVVRSAFMPIAEGFGTGGINERLMTESGANALLTMTLDLLSGVGPKGEALIIPKFGFELSGKINGTLYNTKFFSGSISSDYGAPFTKNVTPAELEAIVRAADLVNAFRKGLQELKLKEKENGDYDAVWNLQN
ncbi:MAG TPA: hypothetical protein DCQ31_04965 [Bacteroidales bacterium]|nr:hypothetical protein [Bacteroidales bacterium]